LLVADNNDRVVSFRKLRDYPLYAVAGREVKVIARHWVESLANLLFFAVPAFIILGLLAILAYRRSHDAVAAHKALLAETARRAAAEAAKAADARFHAIFESDPNGILAVDRSGIIRLTNRRMENLFGYTRQELIGKPVEMLLPWRFRDRHVALRGSFSEHPSTRPMGEGRDLYGLRKDGSEFPVEIGLSAFAADHDTMALANIADITQRKRAAENEKLLNRELQHRTSNLLAVIDAIASRSISGASTLEQARKNLAARLRSLARTHRALAKTNWLGLDLRDLVQAELEPFAGRTTIDGDRVLLTPTAAQNFSLALHELATNAAKYGALSDAKGEIIISWAVSGDEQERRLKFHWRERGGPTVIAPAREGFGSSLLRATLGETRVWYEPHGVNFEANLPLAEITPATVR
jgi:PAS domain S-box-containing protein